MPSTAATKPDYANLNHANLVACLALYQHRQDMSTGINWVSDKTKNLLNYWKAIQMKDFSQLFSAAYYNGIIQQGAEEAHNIYEQAQSAKSEKELQQLLKRGATCRATVQAAMKQLEAIEAGE